MAGRWVKRLAKVLAYLVLALIVIAALAITFTVGWRPIIGAKARPLTDRRFEATPERLKRGEYLVRAVTGCLFCHSAQDEKSSDVPVLVGSEGAGRVFVESGKVLVVAPNITPDPETGIGKWSDDAIARAIREGISADGRPLVPIMGYEEFRPLSDEDLAAVVVYIRSLPRAHNVLPRTNLPFPLSRVIHMFPQPVTAPMPQPDLSTPVKRGEYLTQIGRCRACHTPRTPPPMIQRIVGMELAGGSVFEEGVASANITPDASGIGYYDEALFLQVLRTGHVKARRLKVMPWWEYRNMTDEDLKSVFAYLRTVKPVQHRVDNREPPTLCRLCRHKHGFGDRN